VLDVGAGTGRVALDLARQGVDVVALDREAVLLEALAARAAAAGLRVGRGDADRGERGGHGEGEGGTGSAHAPCLRRVSAMSCPAVVGCADDHLLDRARRRARRP
jgi:SAM-dependent methyltransferase